MWKISKKDSTIKKKAHNLTMYTNQLNFGISLFN